MSNDKQMFLRYVSKCSTKEVNIQYIYIYNLQTKISKDENEIEMYQG